MPRRRGREPYRSNSRELRELAARDRQRIGAIGSALDHIVKPLAIRTAYGTHVQAIIACNHGVPWTNCTVCSKPVRR